MPSAERLALDHVHACQCWHGIGEFGHDTVANVRIAIPPQALVKTGMMAAAPVKAALEVTFDHFSIGPFSLPPQQD